VAYFYYEMAKIRGEMAQRGTSEIFNDNIKNDAVYHSVMVKKPPASPKKR
jgi:hypothetical protein